MEWNPVRRLEYWIIEPSARRRKWQHKQLSDLGTAVRWAASFAELASLRSLLPVPTPAPFITGVIFCNELLDAFPVRRLGWDVKRRAWFEWGVRADGDRFVWARMGKAQGLSATLKNRSRRHEEAEDGALHTKNPPPHVGGYSALAIFRHATKSARIDSRTTEDDTPIDTVRRCVGLLGNDLSPEASSISPTVRGNSLSALEAVLPDGFTLEVCPAAEDWWREAAHSLECGKLVTFDYGLTMDQFFAPERRDGTLRAYRNHRLVSDVLADPGQQDITAQVNFSTLRATGERMGLKTETFESQTQFLTRIASRFWDSESPSKLLTSDYSRQFQTLTHPDHLGRSFRVLLQSRRP